MFHFPSCKQTPSQSPTISPWVRLCSISLREEAAAIMSDSYHNNSSRFLRMLPEPCRHHCHREFRILYQNDFDRPPSPKRISHHHINTSHSSPFCHHSFIPTGTLLTTLRWGIFLCTSSDEKLNMELTSSFWNLVAFYEPVSASPDDFVSSLCVLLVDIYRNFIIAYLEQYFVTIVITVSS